MLAGLLPRTHAHQGEAGNQLLRHRERAIGDEPLATPVRDVNPLRRRAQTFGGQKHLLLQALLDEFVQSCEERGIRGEFGAYWMVIRPFSGWIRIIMLRLLSDRILQPLPSPSAAV